MTMQLGSRGVEVQNLQRLLNKLGYRLEEDGIYGENTQGAVMDFQKKANLSPTGVVEASTVGALAAAAGITASYGAQGSAQAPMTTAQPGVPSTTIGIDWKLVLMTLAGLYGIYYLFAKRSNEPDSEYYDDDEYPDRNPQPEDDEYEEEG